MNYRKKKKKNDGSDQGGVKEKGLCWLVDTVIGEAVKLAKKFKKWDFPAKKKRAQAWEPDDHGLNPDCPIF